MSSYVLDASAALAVIFDEPGGAVVAPLTEDSVMSAVNVAEAFTTMTEKGYSRAQAETTFELLGIVDVAPFDRHQGILAGVLRQATRHRGLSLGDRACLALAYALGLPVLTADRTWAELDVGVEVRVIR